MKSKLFAFVVLLSVVFNMVRGQAPERFKYQAVARDSQGIVSANTEVAIKINILEGSADGASVYNEVHIVTTNKLGLFSLEIGDGGFAEDNEDFLLIDWGASDYFIKVEISVDGLTNFELLGISQLLSVPYALYAKSAGNVNTSDTSATNEIQALSISNDTIYLSNGGFVKLPASVGFSGSYNDLLDKPAIPAQVSDLTNDAGYITQDTTLDETEVDAFVANNGYITSEGDPVFSSSVAAGITVDDTTRWATSSTFSGEFSDLLNVPANLDTDSTNDFDGQYGSLIGAPTNVSSFTNDAGYLTTEVDADSTNELQIITISNDTIYLSDGNYAVLPYTAGTGLSLTGTEFANTAPDQTVTITAGGDASVTGTYPNFTIATTDEDSILFDTRISNLETKQNTDSTYFDTRISSVESKQVSDSTHFQNEIDNIVDNELQKLKVSATGDTLYLTGTNWVIIPGISAENPNSTWEPGDSWQDTRDSQGYGTVQIGNQIWLTDNMNYETDSSYYYNDNAANDTLGRLYQWAYTDSVCPNGWHMPTDAEWDTLELALGVPEDSLAVLNIYRGYADSVGVALREGGSSGFNAELSGYRDNNGFYGEKTIIGGYWTATSAGGGSAYSRRVNKNEKGIEKRTNNEYYGYAVRCVKDDD